MLGEISSFIALHNGYFLSRRPAPYHTATDIVSLLIAARETISVIGTKCLSHASLSSV